ncbi:MAG: Ammonium transporter [Candidatus Jettenia ecosi]|uniref:Ammonium transporter n=1 Tax=Candidatus Jettenia ecosi TaxID=2494326 RepID=A0A533QIF1_9BACT|nr:MAG: Ammonium transporter [Candidatus Jettenia ecosi]
MAIRTIFKLYSIVCIILFCIPLLGVQRASCAAELYEDEFESQTLDPSWLIIRENQSDWNLLVHPGYLRITTKAENLWQINVNNKIKLLRGAPLGDFEVVTKVTYNPKQKFQQAGVIMYESDDNYVMLTRQMDDVDNVEMSRELSRMSGSKSVPTTLTTLYLKLTKSGENVTGSFSGDGNSWTTVDVISGAKLERPKVGIVGFNAQLNTTVDADFDFFKIGAGGEGMASVLEDFIELTKYGKAIHVMAMLMVGFGFLMVFVKRYGYGAVTATYIAVSIVIPYYMFLKAQGIFGEPAELKMDRLILAEFCAASILIATGAFLGRLKMSQYMIMAFMFVPSYMLNEWIMLDNGMGLIPKGLLIDTGGSIVIHQFGAYFGLGVIVRMTTREDFNKKIESDKISNQFSMLGSMILWIFWPSFCAAPAEISKMPLAAVNTILSLCGATVSTYLASTMIRKKIAIEDMANAALAGGVAIGSSCAHTTPKSSLILGFIAGILSVIGFALIQPRVQRIIKGIDTCGVHNLHGMPGVLGGLAAIFIAKNVVPGLQIKAVIVTFIIAWITGLAAGTVVSLFGYRRQSYEDAVEFIVEEEHH